MQRADSLEKTLMLGKIEGRRRRDNKGWDGWMVSPTQWTWVWAGVGDPLSTLLLLPSIFPSTRDFSNESALPTRWPKYWSFSFSISPSNEFSGLISVRIDWFELYCPRDSQESSLIPQFKSISSSALSLLYGPALTSVHDFWKNHSFGYMDLCWQNDVSAF